MTKTQFRLGVLVIFAAILLNNLTSPDRYSVHGTGITMVKIDRITGNVWRARSAGWVFFQHE
jgi:hypothetical protein